jgi:hypothetical protein
LCDSNLEADYHDRFLQGLLHNGFSLSSVDLSKTCVERCKTSEPFKMKAVRSFETSGTAYPVTQDNVPEGRIPLVQRCEIPKARTACLVFSRPTQLPFLVLTVCSLDWH